MDESAQIDQLAELGLSRYEAAAYLGLLNRRSFSATELATHVGVPRQRIYDVLQSLAVKGLAHERVGARRTYLAVPPEQALPALFAARRASLERELAEAQQLTSLVIDAIQPLYNAGSDEDNPLHYIDVLADPRQISARAMFLAEAAHEEILVCFKRPLVSSLEENIAEVCQPRARGVRYRTLYEHAATEDDELLPLMHRMRELGQEIRLLPALPIKMNIYDRRAALLSLQNPVTGRPSITALCLTHPSLAHTLTKAFDAYWAEAEPFH